MKPGNRQMYGANSYRINYLILKDEGVIRNTQLLRQKEFFYFLQLNKRNYLKEAYYDKKIIYIRICY